MKSRKIKKRKMKNRKSVNCFVHSHIKKKKSLVESIKCYYHYSKSQLLHYIIISYTPKTLNNNVSPSYHLYSDSYTISSHFGSQRQYDPVNMDYHRRGGRWSLAYPYFILLFSLRNTLRHSIRRPRD